MFGRLKDFRRIATRYDKLARNFLGSSAAIWQKSNKALRVQSIQRFRKSPCEWP